MAQTRVSQRLVAAIIGVRIVMYEMAGGPCLTGQAGLQKRQV